MSVPMSFQTSSASASGDIGMGLGWDNSGMSVNYGTSADNGAVLILAALAVVFLLWKR